jgi:PhzF family phenazine biosynthesis protein
LARRYRLYQVDAFTRQPFTGNPAGVVPDATGLTDDQMLLIARELNNSETAFVFPPDEDDHDIRVRFFTPATEVPICGHATIATHYVRAHEGCALGMIRQKSPVGVQSITTEAYGADYRIWMRQATTEFAAVIEGGLRDRLCTALGLDSRRLGMGPIQIISTGHSKVLIPVRNRAVLDAIDPDLPALTALSAVIGCNGYYVFTTCNPEAGAQAHGRMFAPAIGIAEDPVTGNASGPLGAYLLRYHLGATSDPTHLAFWVVQGERIRRRGSVFVEATQDSQGAIKVRIAGEAVIAFRTEIEI